MVNRVVLIGRLTRDPNELRTSPSGVSVTSFTVAVDNRFSKQENNKADFIPVVVFNKTAEFICNYARKGALVAVEGRLQQRTYQNKDISYTSSSSNNTCIFSSYKFNVL